MHFGISGFRGGVLAFSRILNDEEVVVVANASTQDSWSGEVIVDLSLHPAGAVLDVLFSNKSFGTEPQPGSGRPSTVVAKASGDVEIREVSGTVTRGPAKAVKVISRADGGADPAARRAMRAERVRERYASCSSNWRASFRSGVPSPSVNQPQISPSAVLASAALPWLCQSRARLVAARNS